MVVGQKISSALKPGLVGLEGPSLHQGHAVARPEQPSPPWGHKPKKGAGVNTTGVGFSSHSL